VHDGNVYYVGMKNIQFADYNQMDYIVCEVRRTAKQELLLNRGRLIYTKSGVFGVNYFNSFWLEDVLSKLTSDTKPTGDQVNSTYHNIEHPVVMSGQRSPSSSEDG
jgi:hypothetical protein